MNKLLEQIKDYGGIGTLIIMSIVAAGVSYGASQATASYEFSDHEKRISAVEGVTNTNSLSIARMGQRIDDLWHDAGHRD